MLPSRKIWIIAILAVLCGITAGFNLAVMSIDLGSEFVKVAIVKPGVPMEIVIDEESARKTPNMVAMRDGERHYGSAAKNTGVKFPKKAFWYLTHVVGLKFEDPQVELYKKRFPYYNLVKDEERGTVLFQIDEETKYSPEELLGMIIEKARINAEAFADQPIKEAVITVPAYFTQSQRKAILNAAEMVNLNILQIMGENAAVALNYGVFRRKMFNSTVQHYMFYDMGATSTTATVVGYQMVKMKEGTRMETNPQLTIKGVGFDRNLGGLEITLRLREHLAKKFNELKKTTTDVFTNDRAMGKLFKEAERVKKVLSANNDHMAQVEGLLDDKDFKSKITRAELEEMCADLFERVAKPIEDALKVSHVTLPEITDTILFGGGTRVPKIQDKLMAALGKKELGKSINTDEAAALGAVYQAAYLGKGFKVKTFAVKEANIFPIIVEFDRHKQEESGEETVRTIRRTLFGRMNPFPQRKVMTFSKHYKDFHFNVTYGDLSFLSENDMKSFDNPMLSTFNLAGVESAHSKNSETAENKGVKAHFRMDENGVLLMDKVESVFEKQGEKEEESTWSKIGNTLGGLFGSKDEKKEDIVTQEESEPPTEAGDKPDEEGSKPDETGSSDQAKASDTGSEKAKPDETGSDNKEGDGEDEKKAEKKEEKVPAEEEEDKKKDDKPKEEKKEDTDKDKKDDKKTDDKSEDKTDSKTNETKVEETKPVNKTIVIRENITTDVQVHDVPELTVTNLKASKKRLADLTAKDKEKKLLEKAKNDLEAYIFDMGDRITQDLYKRCSTEDEREAVSKSLAEASDWMYDQEDSTPRQTYTDKLKSLKKETKDLEFRVKELKERPEALSALKSMLNHSEYFLQTVKNLTQLEDPVFTEVEVTTLEKLINETQKWRKDMIKEQDKVPLTEKPKMLIEDIGLKIQALDREVKYLINKAKYFKPKPKVDKKNETATNETVKEDKSKDTNTTKKAPEEDEEDAKIEVEDDNGATDSKTETESGDPPDTNSQPSNSDETEPDSSKGKADSDPEKDADESESDTANNDAPSSSDDSNPDTADDGEPESTTDNGDAPARSDDSNPDTASDNEPESTTDNADAPSSSDDSNSDTASDNEPESTTDNGDAPSSSDDSKPDTASDNEPESTTDNGDAPARSDDSEPDTADDGEPESTTDNGDAPASRDDSKPDTADDGEPESTTDEDDAPASSDDSEPDKTNDGEPESTTDNGDAPASSDDSEPDKADDGEPESTTDNGDAPVSSDDSEHESKTDNDETPDNAKSETADNEDTDYDDDVDVIVDDDNDGEADEEVIMTGTDETDSTTTDKSQQNTAQDKEPASSNGTPTESEPADENSNDNPTNNNPNTTDSTTQPTSDIESTTKASTDSATTTEESTTTTTQKPEENTHDASDL